MDSQQSPMAAKPTSRKPHRKTRTGCRTCKARKIKCDEQRPACTNCIKHSVQCDYLLTPASSSASPGAFPNNSNPYAAGTPRTSGDVGISLPHEPPILNMMDLELLHNFCTSTCMTLHNDPGLKTLWRINVPQLGFQYDFVMRGILAISALHMASWAPEEKKGYYLSQAFTQHQNGLRVATSILPNITDENCSALYIFSALTLFFTLAGPRDSTEFLIVGDSGTADWLILLKGVQSIIASAHPTLIRSSLGPMFLAGSRRDAIRETIYQQVSDEEDPLQELLSHLERAGYPENEYQLCVQAVNELRKSHATIRIQKPHEFESADIFIWFFRVEDDYVQLLREHHQGALAVFAHFCVLLKMIDYRWWVGSVATYHLSRVYRLLDAEHRLWIRWPIEEMGWIPNAADTPMESKDTLMMDTGSPHNASLPPS